MAREAGVVTVPEEYAGTDAGDVVMGDTQTSRIASVAICVVDDAHSYVIARDALVHMMFGVLPWLQCCGDRVLVVTRAVPITEVKA